MFNQVNKGLNKQAERMHDEMMERCVPVAKKILKIIVDLDLSVGDKMIQRDQNGNVIPMKEGARPEGYVEAAKQIQELFLETNLKWMERHMIFMLVKQPMDMLQNIVLQDLETTYQESLCRMFGIRLLSDLDFKKINDFCAVQLTKPAVPEEVVEEEAVEVEAEAVVEEAPEANTTNEEKAS